MKPIKSLIALGMAAMLATTANAAENLTGETASPGGSIHLSMAHLAEVAAEAGVANIQVAAGQTLTNSVQNVAEGKTDVAGTPYILPFLLAKGRGPYSKLGAEKGAELASNLRALYPVTLGIFALYAFDSKGISGWDGLEGKTIYNGITSPSSSSLSCFDNSGIITLIFRYSSELSSACPEMISGVRASSIRIESTSSITAKCSAF